jgi:alpha-glucoside transport system permease protein
MTQILSAAIAVVVAVLGLILIFYLLNLLTQALPYGVRRWVQPFAFALPALVLVGLVLVYPVVDTLRISFYDDKSVTFVGLANYRALAVDPTVHEALINNAVWLALVPAVTLLVGLLVAWLADRLSSRGEILTKTVIFLPMVISFVGAGTIWGFIYQYRPSGRPQIGLLNAIRAGLGLEPEAWLTEPPLNNLMLMVIVVWIQAGLATVLLSAAIKSVPHETVEAARVDGATEVQVFLRIIIPQIKTTITLVLSTLVIFVLKIFDIVYVMTNGNFGTEVVADLFIKQIFTYNQYGKAAAVVIVLLVLVSPVIVLNIRRFRHEEAAR